jgi:DNA-binding HxlR family transcriptional regulator
MQRVSFSNMNCSIAQALEVVGEWWSLLIVRDALFGVSRFDEFQERLGISRNVLNERLTRLVEEGVLEKVLYQEHPPRYDYRLTEKGRDLWQVLNAMKEWGDRWAAPLGPPTEFVHRTCGEHAHVVPTCSACGEVLVQRDLKVVPGPGYDTESHLLNRPRRPPAEGAPTPAAP